MENPIKQLLQSYGDNDGFFNPLKFLPHFDDTILFRDPFLGAPPEQLRIGQECTDESIILEVFVVVSDPQGFPAEL